jgi:hypothetical protein
MPGGGAPVLSPAYDPSWRGDNYGGTLHRGTIDIPRPVGVQDIAGVGASSGSATWTFPIVHAQHIGPATLPAGVIAGDFRTVGAVTSQWTGGEGAFWRVVLRVLSADGSTVRGTLFAGSAAGTKAGGTPTTRTVAGPKTPGVAQAGDRLVIENGL